MTDLKLTATRRTVIGKHVAKLRRQGELPAVLYGPHTEPVAIQLNAREAARVLRGVRGADLIDLTFDGDTRQVLLQDLQRHPVRGDYLHADFYAVDMTRTIRVNVPVRLVGSSYAVNTLSGALVRGLNEIEVEALPGDLVAFIEADLAALREIGDAIHVRDLTVPPTFKVLTEPDELIARVTMTREEDLTEPTAVGAEVEVIEKGKAEEEGEGEGEE